MYPYKMLADYCHVVPKYVQIPALYRRCLWTTGPRYLEGEEKTDCRSVSCGWYLASRRFRVQSLTVSSLYFSSATRTPPCSMDYKFYLQISDTGRWFRVA